MTLRLMCDSDRPSELERAAFAATYSDLLPTQSHIDALQARLGATKLIIIDRGLGDPTGQASVADVERGAMTPADLPAWRERKRADLVSFITVYHSWSLLADVLAALGGEAMWHWIARWGHLTATTPGLASVQFASASMLSSACDWSVVHDDRWHPEAGPGERVTAALANITRAEDALRGAVTNLTSASGPV